MEKKLKELVKSTCYTLIIPMQVDRNKLTTNDMQMFQNPQQL